MTTGTEVIVADDNPRDRDFVAELLTNYKIITATNGEEVLTAVAQRSALPLVVSDLQMPGVNGIELARQLWQARPDARIVFWTQYSDEIYVRSLAGIIPAETVYGYVLKDNSAETLQKAIHAVFDEVQCWIDPKIRPVQARLNRSDHSITDAEYEVLIDIALGLTDNAIARRRYLSRRGVQSRLRSLYSKLEVDNLPHVAEPVTETLNLRSRAVSIALRRGLLNPHELEREETQLADWLHQNE